MSGAPEQVSDETAVHDAPAAAAGGDGAGIGLERAVLGFDSLPGGGAKAAPGLITTEMLGDPHGAQERSAARRREEAKLEDKLREPHEGGTILERHGTGTTPYSHRLKHEVGVPTPSLRVCSCIVSTAWLRHLRARHACSR